jgi:hypothetical protein
VTSTNGSATITTNGTAIDIAVTGGGGAGWSGVAATQVVNVAGFAVYSMNTTTGNVSSTANGAVQRGYGASGAGPIVVSSGPPPNNAHGTEQAGIFSGGALPSILGFASGSRQYGNFVGSSPVITGSYGAVQSGSFQSGVNVPTIGSGAHGSMQIGKMNRWTMTGIGSIQAGSFVSAIDTSGATNTGAGSIQLINLNDGQSALMTGNASIGLGAVSQTNDASLMAAGKIITLQGFEGDANGLTNFPATVVTTTSGNTNYYRYTAAPSSNTAFGLQHQIAYDSTNIFIYHAASSKWLRVTGTLEW